MPRTRSENSEPSHRALAEEEPTYRAGLCCGSAVGRLWGHLDRPLRRRAELAAGDYRWADGIFVAYKGVLPQGVACIVVAYIVMVCIVMAYVVIACIPMAYILMACVVMAHIGLQFGL